MAPLNTLQGEKTYVAVPIFQPLSCQLFCSKGCIDYLVKTAMTFDFLSSSFEKVLMLDARKPWPLFLIEFLKYVQNAYYIEVPSLKCKNVCSTSSAHKIICMYFSNVAFIWLS